MKKKVAIVTGGSGGIGGAICSLLSKNDYDVINLDIKVDNKHKSIKCDVSNEEDIIAAKKVILEEYKIDTIDLLVNTAGIFCYKERGEIIDISFEEWKKVLNLNLDSVFLCSKYFIPLLKNSQNYPSVINISSDQVIKPRRKSGAYAVSKAGISSLTKILACELSKYKIRVNEIASASVKTNFINDYFGSKNVDVEEIYNNMDNQMPFGLIMPNSIAEMVIFLSGKKAKNITGQTILIDSGFLL